MLILLRINNENLQTNIANEQTFVAEGTCTNLENPVKPDVNSMKFLPLLRKLQSKTREVFFLGREK